MRARGLVRNSVPGNGIERNQVELARHVAHERDELGAHARAESLTPSSITYSNVTKSRGAAGR